MSPRKLPLFVFALLSFSSLACVVRARPVAYYEPAPAAAVYYDDPGDSAEVVVVDSGPPPEQVENPGPPPRRGHVWVRGRWVHTAAYGWAWRSGHWERPRAGHAWVAGHWQRHNHRWVWVKGHWQRGRTYRG